MGFREIIYRVHEQVEIIKFRLQYLLGIGVSLNSSYNHKHFSFTSSDSPCLPSLSWKTISEAEKLKILSGVLDMPGDEWCWSNEDDIWFRSLKGQATWPKTFFNSIDYRQGNIYGDARVCWEPARLQQLMKAALLVDSVDDESSDRLVLLIEDQLNSWVRSNPPLSGIHYVSSMECALRIISTCYAIDFVRNKLCMPKQTWNNILKLVWTHASIIEKRISLHSSAGNHTIAECAGLIFAGVLFPEFKESKRWKMNGERILFREITHQINQDGGGVEQTLWYHVFILDLIGLVVKLYEHYGKNIEDEINTLYTNGCKFINVFAKNIDDLPALGDSDNGYALSECLNIIWDETFYIEGLTVFHESGYSVYNNSRLDQQLIFDHGSLGMSPSYGHGHADALSLILKYGADNVLIDPGTYTYTGDQNWRSYFRGTRAHNTVIINGLDQSKQETAFLWSKPYISELKKVDTSPEGVVRLLACHNGYKELGIMHWRGVVVSPTGYVIVFDFIDGVGEFDVELNWHIGVQAVKSDNIYQLNASLAPLYLQVEGRELTSHSGELDPIRGWMSAEYGVKKPATTLSTRETGALPVNFVTQICTDIDMLDKDLINKEMSIIRGWVS